MFGKKRSVIFIGDDSVRVYYVTGLNVKPVGEIAWADDGFEQTLRGYLVRECKRSPVIILGDMVEQHYRKEIVPKSNMFDHKSMLDRRLGMAFPNYTMRAALKQKKSVTGEKGQPYLLVAVPNSEAVSKTVEATRQAGVSVLGFYMLPVEGAAMVRALSKSLNKGNEVRSQWTVFLGQQNNGMLRQIVLRNGELALTRMTPIVNTDVESHLWARDMHEELNATISYITRFGYKKQDGLDIIAIANDQAANDLKDMINVEADLFIMSAHEAANHLSIRTGFAKDERYADPLYAGYTAQKGKFVLPLRSRRLEAFARPRKIANYATAALTVLGLITTYLVFSKTSDLQNLREEIVVSSQALRSQQTEYQRQLQRQKDIGFDFALIKNAVRTYNSLEQQKLNILPVIQKIGLAQETDLTFDRFDVEAVEEEDDNNRFSYGNDDNQKTDLNRKRLLRAVLFMSFPKTIDPILGVQRIEEFESQLKTVLPAYDVRIIKQIADLSYTGNVVGGSEEGQDNSDARFEAEIEISEKPPQNEGETL